MQKHIKLMSMPWLQTVRNGYIITCMFIIIIMVVFDIRVIDTDTWLHFTTAPNLALFRAEGDKKQSTLLLLLPDEHTLPHSVSHCGWSGRFWSWLLSKETERWPVLLPGQELPWSFVLDLESFSDQIGIFYFAYHWLMCVGVSFQVQVPWFGGWWGSHW